MKKTLCSVLSTILLAPFAFSAEFITIGTGSVTGTYYPTGGAVCRLVNKFKKDSKVRCSVESTGGSVYNIKAINEGELDFGIAQSDAVYQAVNGVKKFENNPVKKLRAVMAIYPEFLTLITRKDANIKSIMDIKGKRINIGNIGSGNEATAVSMMKALGLKVSDLSYAGRLSAGEAPDALRDNKIDGYFFMVGHPTANIKDAASATDIRITPISGIAIDNFVKENPFYIKGEIPANLYKGVTTSTPTFGAKAVLVTSSDVDSKTVYTLVKAVMEDFETFKRLHPVYKYIKKESLLEGINAPLHDGAIKYFKENNLMK